MGAPECSIGSRALEEVEHVRQHERYHSPVNGVDFLVLSIEFVVAEPLPQDSASFLSNNPGEGQFGYGGGLLGHL